MTKDDIIRMAREAGFERLRHTDNDWVCYPEEIEAFAKLVAEHERERLHDKFMAMHESQKHSNNYFHFAARQIKENT